mmetsp:Transcript_143832/g.400882  ORF Transcript_143832/g.400882 Transcript_143832/m.400882 type:complete len:200 (-) Transcript_143832:410-1009(-)
MCPDNWHNYALAELVGLLCELLGAEVKWSTAFPQGWPVPVGLRWHRAQPPEPLPSHDELPIPMRTQVVRVHEAVFTVVAAAHVSLVDDELLDHGNVASKGPMHIPCQGAHKEHYDQICHPTHQRNGCVHLGQILPEVSSAIPVQQQGQADDRLRLNGKAVHTCKCHIVDKEHKGLEVAVSYAGVGPWTVVVHPQDAAAA